MAVEDDCLAGQRRPRPLATDGANEVEPLEIELEVGETLFLGDYSLTLLDTDGERIDVRIDSTEGLDADGFDFDADAVFRMHGKRRFTK